MKIMDIANLLLLRTEVQKFVLTSVQTNITIRYRHIINKKHLYCEFINLIKMLFCPNEREGGLGVWLIESAFKQFMLKILE